MKLSDPYPDFLDDLDRDRPRALVAFRRFAEEFFRHAPPPIFFRVPPDDREDVVSEVILHCIDNDCAKLRKFTPRRGATFAGWFAVVASRKISDRLQRRQRQKDLVDERARADDDPPPSPPDPFGITAANELERLFLKALKQIGRRCRLLLRLKFLQYKNREIVQVLRLPRDHNKTIGNQVLECRKRLVRLLGDVGYFETRRT